MVIVVADVVVKDGSQSAFLAEAKKCVTETRKEDGCLSYGLFASTDSGADYSFLERWESQAALDAHLKTAHFAAFAENTKPFMAKDLAISVYDAKKM